MLYYFNFVQVPFFAGAEPPVRTGMIAGGLVSRALWWFRWGAMLTFITGWLYLLDKMFRQFGGVQPFFSVSYGWAIFIGGIIGSLMWFNVWFIIWPAQQVVMASTARVKEGGQAIPEAAARGARGGVTSRTNTMLSIPMLFFMGSASHFAFFTPTARGAKIAMLVIFLIILAIVQGNAVVGPATPDKASAGKKLLGTVKGTLWAGFVLTAIFVIALKIIFA
jgi:uncharacterized membrane protein